MFLQVDIGHAELFNAEYHFTVQGRQALLYNKAEFLTLIICCAV